MLADGIIAPPNWRNRRVARLRTSALITSRPLLQSFKIEIEQAMSKHSASYNISTPELDVRLHPSARAEQSTQVTRTPGTNHWKCTIEVQPGFFWAVGAARCAAGTLTRVAPRVSRPARNDGIAGRWVPAGHLRNPPRPERGHHNDYLVRIAGSVGADIVGAAPHGKCSSSARSATVATRRSCRR